MEEQLSGQVFSRPEFLYYWVYYAGFNAPWAVVPVWLLRDSWGVLKRAVEAAQKMEVVKEDEAERRR